MTPSQLQPGETLGRYRIVRVLGSGAMGDVYLADDPQIGRRLAIKTVRIDGGSATVIEDRKQRLLREMRAAGRLLHPNAVTLFDTGEDRGLVFLAFEYVEGCDLQERRHRAPALEVRDVVRFVRQTAAALAEAHRLGIVHRDIKPSNIMVTRAGDAKVGDFGIAKLLEGTTTDLTNTGTVVGSPQYMAPEQIRGEPLDGRADQFSLGTVLYELLARKAPFSGETITTLVYQILHHQPVDLAELRPDLSPELCAVVRRMMTKDREQRFAGMNEVAEELTRIERSLPAGEEPISSEAPTVIQRVPTSASQRLTPTPTPPVLPPTPAAPPPAAPPPLEPRAAAPPPVSRTPAPPAAAPSSGRRVVMVAAIAGLFLLVLLGGAAMVAMRFLSRPDDGAATPAAQHEPPPGHVAASSTTVAPDRRPASELSPAAATAPAVSTSPGSAQEDRAASADAGRRTPAASASTSAPPIVRRLEREADPPRDARPTSEGPRSRPAPPGPSGAPPAGQNDEATAEREPPRLPSPDDPPADPFAGIAVDAARASALSLTFEVEPKTAFVQIRGPQDARFLSVGVVDDYGAGKRKPRGLELPGPGTYLVRLRAEGRQDYVLKVTASPGGSAAPVRVALRGAGVRSQAQSRYRVREGVCFNAPPRRAQTTVDGADRGPARAYDCASGGALALAPGEHTVELALGGARTLRFQVDVTSDASQAQARIDLPSQPGEP